VLQEKFLLMMAHTPESPTTRPECGCWNLTWESVEKTLKFSKSRITRIVTDREILIRVHPRSWQGFKYLS
jgi:hypothetical protein